MGTQQTPAPGDNQAIENLGAQNEARMVAAYNAATIALYNQDLAVGKPTAPPIVLTFNQDLYIELAGVASGDDPRWASVLSMSIYQPPAQPPVAVELPTRVVQPYNESEFPGWYELAPDSAGVPDGTKVTIGGVEWTKGTIPGAASPMTGPQHGWRAQ